jgi:hypothetical protein
MHDFGNINLKGLGGVFKTRSFYKPGTKRPARTLTIESGPGCLPEPGTGRAIKVRWADGTHDNVSSYDLELVVEDDHDILPKEGQ